MAKKKHNRRTHSVSRELLLKSREAALSAVQIFNSPMLRFKSEIYIVLMNIAWTYLLHAYYRQKKVEYRHHTNSGNRRRFQKTKHGADKYWGLEDCLDNKESPIAKDAANNLRFLIGIRHEIEHQMTGQIDSTLSAKFQACCLNYNEYVKNLFGDKYAIDNHLAFSLQFSSISQDQAKQFPSSAEMPAHIGAFISDFERGLSNEELNSPNFAYRVFFVPKTANSKGQADEVIEFVKADTDLASNLNKKYTVIKETERPKHLPSGVVKIMQQEGFTTFSIHWHTQLWKSEDAKKHGKGLGVEVGKIWYWYDSWVEVVRQHCKDNAAKYGKTKA